MNELFTFSTFKELEILIPLDFKTSFLGLSEIFDHKNKEFELYEQALWLAPLISNISLPFRMKEERESMNEYINKIIFFKGMNVFNIKATIPIINKKGVLLNNNIFDYKKKKGRFVEINSFGDANFSQQVISLYIFYSIIKEK